VSGIEIGTANVGEIALETRGNRMVIAIASGIGIRLRLAALSRDEEVSVEDVQLVDVNARSEPPRPRVRMVGIVQKLISGPLSNDNNAWASAAS